MIPNSDPSTWDLENEELPVFDEPAGETNRTSRPGVAAVPAPLQSLARLMSDDAIEKFLARVAPHSWRFRVFRYEPEHEEALSWPEEDEEEASPLCGFRMAERAQPVTICGRDLVEWLISRGHTGQLAIEWFPPKGVKQLHFVSVDEAPEHETGPNMAPVRERSPWPVPAAPQPVGKVDPAAQQMQLMEFFARLQAQSEERMYTMIREMGSKQKELLLTVTARHDVTLDQLQKMLAEDPAREIGKRVFERALEDTMHRVTTRPKGDFEELTRKLTEADNAKSALKKFLRKTDPGQSGPEEDSALEKGLTDLLMGVLKQKMGLKPEIGETVGKALSEGDADNAIREGFRMLQEEDAA